MPTYTPLESIQLTTTSSSVVFSNIPQSYTDLVIVGSFYKLTGGSPRLRPNGDSSSLYSQTVLYGNGSSALSGRDSGNGYFLVDYFNPSTSQPNLVTIHLNNYSNTTTLKPIIERSGAANLGVVASVGLYRSTNAISSITIIADGGSGVFETGTTFNLYGIRAGSAKASGGTVRTDGTYWYHTFTSSGVFSSYQNMNVDYLVVAGGGGGGAGSGWGGGGGGAGGMRSTVTATGGGGSVESALAVTAADYQVLIGAGGIGATYQNQSQSGGNSTFGPIISTGGGGGGAYSAVTAGSSGGSGGGGGTGQSGGSGTANQGYAGGSGSTSTAAHGGGGGGGAGAVGSNGTTSVGGNGGVGVASSISGTSVTYAGGGGGGANTGYTGGSGGSGGGGTGGAGNFGTNGSTNTGSGGGGGGWTYFYGGNGGSGIVIVRYAV